MKERRGIRKPEKTEGTVRKRDLPFFRAMYRGRTNGKQFGCGQNRNFCWGRRPPKKCLLGLPKRRSLVTKCPKEVGCVTGAIASVPYRCAVRKAEQMGRCWPLTAARLRHIPLGLRYFGIEGLFCIARLPAACFFRASILGSFYHRLQFIHSGTGRPVGGQLPPRARPIFFEYRAAL